MKKKKYLAIFMAMSMATATAPVTALADDATDATTDAVTEDKGDEPVAEEAVVEEAPVADTPVVQEASDENSDVVDETPAATVVAKIGDTGYNTLADALAAAETGAGATITLAADIKEDVTVPENANITIDLNGKTITNNGGHTITNNGTLTITDSSDAVGTVDNVTNEKGAIYNNGTLTILAGNFTRSEEKGLASGQNGNSWYVILNHGTMAIGSEDGNNDKINVSATGQYSSLVENGWQNGNDNTSQADSKLTIYGGSFKNASYVIKNDDYGVLDIKDGKFTALESSRLTGTVLNWNIATISGGTFESEMFAILNQGYGKESVDKAQLTITGGTFRSKEASISQADKDRTFGDVTITGGEFITENNKPLVDTNVNRKDGDTFVVSGGVFSGSDVKDYMDVNKKTIQTKDNGYVVAEGISLDGVTRVRRGNTTTLKAIVKANGETYDVAGKVTWATSDATVATVDANGVVTGVAVGHATITATVNQAEAEPAPKAEGDEAATGGDSTTTSDVLTASCTVDVYKKSSSSSSSGGGGGSASTTTNKTTISDSKNGAVTASSAKAETGDKVTLTPKADEGYVLDKITVKDKDGKEVALKAEKDGTYSFTMPKGGVTVDTTFKQADGTENTDKPAADTKTIVLQIGSTAVIVDNQAIINDVAPVIRNDRTLVPIRVITEALGGQVAWNEAAKEVTLTVNGKEIKMTIGKTLEKYGVAPVIIGDRTFVPVRFVADELGAATTWDDATKTVTIKAVK